MRIIKLLALGFLAGCVYSASPMKFQRTERYGQLGQAGGLDSGQSGQIRGRTVQGPLMVSPTSMVRVGSCDIDGCMIYFTDTHASTIRLFHKKPTDVIGTITTIAGTYGTPGNVDGPVVEIPDGGHHGHPGGHHGNGHHHGGYHGHPGGHHGSGNHHGHGGERPIDGLRYDSDSDGSDGHTRHGHKHGFDYGDGSEEERELAELRRTNPELLRLVEECLDKKEREERAGHEHKSDYEDGKSRSRRDSLDSISDGLVDCSDDGSLPGLTPIFGHGRGPALLSKPHCITALEGANEKFIIFGEQTGSLRGLQIKSGRVPFVATIDPHANPVALTSDRSNKVYYADDQTIFEMDFSQQPPVKTIIAGTTEVEVDGEDDGGDFNMVECIQKIMKQSPEELLKKYQDESGSISESDEDDFGVSMGRGKVKETLLKTTNGVSSLAHSGDSLYYTTAGSNAIEQLTKTSGSWSDKGTMKTEDPDGHAVTFKNPTYVNAKEGGGFLILDDDGLKNAELSTDPLKPGTYVVKLIIPADAENTGDKDHLTSGAVVAVECCNGAIEVGGGHVIETFQPVAQPGSPPSGSTVGTLADAGAAIIKTASGGDNVDEQDFRFGLSTEQITLTMRQRGVNFAETNTPYSRALNALEKAVDSSHAIKQIGKGMTVWVSGLYTQASLSPMFGNPAMKDKHYAIMAGTHYKDAATQQIFGIAVNVGFGNSVAKTDKDIRKDSKAAQFTLYYNKKFDEEGHWKFSWHNSLMRSMDRHQRPFDENGSKQIAIGNCITYEFSSSAELSYKHEFCKDNYINPFTAINYIFNKDMAYEEKNVGINNLSYSSASMSQIGLQFGIKSSFGKRISETKTFVIMPKISYTNFAKMGVATQTSTNMVSGRQSEGKSGTPGRHLISATLGLGVVDYEANMTTRVAYTGNIQKHKRSHEIVLDWGMKF